MGYLGIQGVISPKQVSSPSQAKQGKARRRSKRLGVKSGCRNSQPAVLLFAANAEAGMPTLSRTRKGRFTALKPCFCFEHTADTGRIPTKLEPIQRKEAKLERRTASEDDDGWLGSCRTWLLCIKALTGIHEQQ